MKKGTIRFTPVDWIMCLFRKKNSDGYRQRAKPEKSLRTQLLESCDNKFKEEYNNVTNLRISKNTWIDDWSYQNRSLFLLFVYKICNPPERQWWITMCQCYYILTMFYKSFLHFLHSLIKIGLLV